MSTHYMSMTAQGGAEQVAPEMPYELLRRADRYEVRRYPPHVAAQTRYSKRPEGYDRLGSFVQVFTDCPLVKGSLAIYIFYFHSSIILRINKDALVSTHATPRSSSS